jgi:hypothetical protein
MHPRITGACPPRLRRLARRAAASRGAGMLEYALLAALAVGLFFLLKTLLPNVFNDMINKVSGAVNS